MTPENYEYGLWSLVLVNSVFFILFAASFFKPQSRQDWRTLGMFSAFLVALFTEMYGFPLTIYLLSGWLTERFPGINWLSHDAGHLPEMLFGWKGNPHFGPFHLLSSAFHPGRLLACCPPPGRCCTARSAPASWPAPARTSGSGTLSTPPSSWS
jgi:hypothetical protein